jgi:hypothetical protein
LLNVLVSRAQANHGQNDPVNAKADAKADAYEASKPLTLDVNTTHFNGPPPFSIFKISRILLSSSSALLQISPTFDRSLKPRQTPHGSCT